MGSLSQSRKGGREDDMSPIEQELGCATVAPATMPRAGNKNKRAGLCGFSISRGQRGRGKTNRSCCCERSPANLAPGHVGKRSIIVQPAHRISLFALEPKIIRTGSTAVN